MILALTWAVGSMPSFAAEPWRQWGGPERDFQVESGALAVSWPAEGPPVLWRQELAGGYSGVLVEGNRLYTATRRDDGPQYGGPREVLLALDARNGKILWETGAPVEPFESQVLDFGKGPNATPLLIGDQLVLVGFAGRMQVVDKGRGKPLWQRDLVKEFGADVHRFGYSNAPIAHGGLVIVLLGGEQHGAVGFEPETGEVRWRTPPFSISYASPGIVKVGDDELLVLMTPSEVLGVALEGGDLRFRYPHKNRYSTNCLTPLWNGKGLLFVSSQADGGSLTLRLNPQKGGTVVEEVARSKDLKIFHHNALLLGDHIYASHNSILTAYDYRAGTVAWKKRGFPKLNLVAADGKAVGLDENGKLFLLELSPTGVNVLGDHQILDKPSWTPPSLVGTRLYARDPGQLVAVELGASAADDPSLRP